MLHQPQQPFRIDIQQMDIMIAAQGLRVCDIKLWDVIGETGDIHLATLEYIQKCPAPCPWACTQNVSEKDT